MTLEAPERRYPQQAPTFTRGHLRYVWDLLFGLLRLIARYGAIEDFPPEVLSGERRTLALLFKDLATLRTDAPLFADVEALRWRGPTEAFATWTARIGDARLAQRVDKHATRP